jgi:23S rRNA (adenine-N6)-dimethyltransferase
VVEQPRRWGWHRLAEPWPTRLVLAAGVRPGEFVVDLGAGDGALTGALLAAGARVLAVELHPGRAARLRARFPEARVVQADLQAFTFPGRGFRVVANPPYSISALLWRRLFRSRMYAADLVLPAWCVADSVRRGHRDYQLRRGTYIPRTAFRPAPPVDASVLVIRRGPPRAGR